jgi:hypothetical protein
LRSTIQQTNARAYFSQLFQRKEDTFLALLNDSGKPVDLRKTDWIDKMSDKQFTVVFSEASPMKKPRIDENKELSKTDKLVRLFKNVKDMNTDLRLEEDVVQVKPDLPLVKKHKNVIGQADLRNVIDFDQTFCLNESSDHPWQNIFQKGKDVYLESDVDEQILLNIRFAEPVNLHSFVFKGGPECRVDCFPAKLHLFFNEFSIDFDKAEGAAPRQSFTFTSDNYKDKKLVILDPFKWQNVSAIAFYVVSNLGGEDTSIIHSIKFFGKPSKRKNAF